MPSVSILVVDYNSGALLRRCLEALAVQTLHDFEVLLVQNGSEGAEWMGQIEWDFPLRVIRPGRNLGFAAATNLAAREARSPWLATLNPDAFPAPDWLEHLLGAASRHPGIASFASTQRSAQNPELLDGAGDPYSPLGFAWRGGKGLAVEDALPAEGAVFGPCAAAALYRLRDFHAAGGFDETFFCYYEDVDLAFRLRLAGHGCVFVPAAVVDHVGSALVGTESPFTLYHTTRNRIWTFIKNMPGLWLWVLLIPAALVVLRSLLREHSSIKARALVDALRRLPGVRVTRRAIQRHRVVSAFALARAFTWSLAKTKGGVADVRPLPPVGDPTADRVCAVVVSYHRGERLRHTLPAILEQVERLVVVDNGSGSETLEVLHSLSRAWGQRLVLLPNEENLGLARAQNQGIGWALAQGYPWVLLLDDDSLPEPGMVEALLAAYRDAPRNCPIGLLSPYIARLGLDREQAYAIARHPLELRRCGFGGQPLLHDLLFAIASGSLIPAVILRRVGVMREGFFIDYVDIDFCLRLREAGYTIVAVAKARLQHFLGQTEERRLLRLPLAVTHHNPWRRYHIFRNRVTLWREHWRHWPAWTLFDLGAALLDLVRILSFEEDRRAKIAAALRGAWDGWRGHLANGFDQLA